MKTIFIVALMGISLSLFSQVYNVPGDFTSIQNAIDNVSDGDTILLSQNEYFENIIIDKPLTLTSNYILSGNQNDIETTIINGGQIETTIRLENIETDTVRFIGITITGGAGYPADPEGFGFDMPHGGGMYIDTVNAVVINHSHIIENSIPSEHNNGGGIYCNHSSLKVINSVISDNTVRGGSFNGDGAGIYFYNSEALIDNTSFLNNSSSVAYGNGGAVFSKYSTVNIKNSEFSENDNIQGGAIYSTDTDISITNSTFSLNYAMITSAISIYNNEIYNCFFDGLTVTNNTSASNNGSGAFGIRKADGYIKNSGIENNVSGHSIGGFSISHSSLLVSDCTINNNISTSGVGGDGGGMGISHSSLEIKNTEISNNQCLPEQVFSKGGAFFVNYSNLMLDSVSIDNNFGGQGGAIYSIFSDIKTQNTQITNNSSVEGGAFYTFGSYFEIISTTIADNSAASGSAFYAQHSDLISVNSIFWNDNNDEFFFRQDEDSSSFSFAYSDIRGLDENISQGPETEINWLAGNLNTLPLFNDNQNDDYSLQDVSPLVNEGIAFFEFNETIIINSSSEDYFGVKPDIGAYENWNVLGNSEISENISPLFDVFPNPTNGKITITIENPENSFLSIMDMTGKRIKQEVILNRSNTVDLSSYGSGVYFLRLISGSSVSGEVLIVK